ncbi:MAG: Crp/Fnr family transcriptional regulator [Ferruginibacter sp.]|nr:Crp/Fnr family transcriptional regulator [Cytophagales bacterium]
MFELLRETLTKSVRLSDEEFAYFLTFLKEKTLQKKEFLLRAGEVCNHVAFIRQGCLRYYYVKNGVEHNGQFFFEGSWLGEYYSFLSRKPALQFIDALEDAQLWLLHHDHLHRLYREIPRFESFGRAMAENVVIGSQRRTASFLFDSPEERYLNLLRERPKVMERIPLHHIASYLGIKPESLSRIRKRMADSR